MDNKDHPKKKILDKTNLVIDGECYSQHHGQTGSMLTKTMASVSLAPHSFGQLRPPSSRLLPARRTATRGSADSTQRTGRCNCRLVVSLRLI